MQLETFNQLASSQARLVLQACVHIPTWVFELIQKRPSSLNSGDSIMAGISTHILNASLGQPATQVLVKLFEETSHGYILIDEQFTDADGRIQAFNVDSFIRGHYQLVFEVGDYFQALNTNSFYPRVCIDFKVNDIHQHYHVPLLISPFSYSTYRGS